MTVAETETDGCLIDRVRAKPAITQVTYTKHVAPILQNHARHAIAQDRRLRFR